MYDDITLIVRTLTSRFCRLLNWIKARYCRNLGPKDFTRTWDVSQIFHIQIKSMLTYMQIITNHVFLGELRTVTISAGNYKARCIDESADLCLLLKTAN
ncbi:hypothetical protein CEXT_643971 [Caerostris extrusa]|uniref:Uncharacterized protein n=1 Tax=Caerostris extrusa TaxID=172846 RepID=A0AAV4Y4R2_CAEEX|nr:hypothetical protein CEXT_643971 [Caerostris extrusa]